MADEMQQDEYQQQMDGNQNGQEEQQTKEEIMTEGQVQQTACDDDEDEDEKKLFVGGLSWETTTKDLREYFEKYGEVSNCHLKTDFDTRKSRGFGFVSFASIDTVEKVLAEGEHKLHGRTIDPKKANPRPINKKVFVGRLDPAIKEEDVRAYFETFGPVDKLELPYDKHKDQRRAFCFVEFKRSSSMKKCLETQNHKVGTQEVEVKKATPPGGGTQMGMGRGAPRGRGGFGPGRGGRGGFQGGYGGGYNNYGYNNQNYGYGSGYDQGYNYGYGGYDQSYGYAGGYGGGWNGYDQGYGGYGSYGGYDQWGYGQGGGQSNFGKTQKRGAAHGGYHPYNR